MKEQNNTLEHVNQKLSGITDTAGDGIDLKGEDNTSHLDVISDANTNMSTNSSDLVRFG